MLIRTEQMETLSAASEGGFQTEMENHVRDFVPRLAGTAGESGVRQFVRQGIARAREHEFSARDSIRFFLDTACVLGHRFDTDPQYGWAGAVLHDASLDGEDERADMLARHLYDYMDAVAGPNNELAAAALRRLEAACPDRLENLPVTDPERAAEGVRETYPQKYAYAGKTRLLQLFGEAAKAAQNAAPGLKQAETLIGALMLGMGHGAFDDPLYPWIGGVLRDPLLTTPQARFTRLYDRTRTWLSRVSGNLGEARGDA